MGFFKDLKQTLQGNPDLSQLTPEQRATVERNLADVAARQAQVPTPAPSPPTTAKGALRAGWKEMVAGVRGSVGDARQAIAEDFDRGETDPVRAAQIALAERAARDTARQPFRSPHAAPGSPLITRVVTTGASQLTEVADHLRLSGLAARPDLLYGVYRVPDRLDPNDGATRGDESAAPVEWDFVHAPLPAGLPQVPVQAVWLGVDEHWVRRRIGDPSVIDEELAMDVCGRLGINGNQLVAAARVLSAAARYEGADDEGIQQWSATEVRPLGIITFHTNPGADTAMTSLAGQVPFEHTPPPGLHVELLDWAGIAATVQPRPQLPPLVPSRAPHLPATPQELLTMYLEVVGVRPEDCLSVQATVRAPMAVAAYGNELTGNLARLPALPCADGTARPRLHAGDTVVVAYHDRPGYDEGRRRWAAYCEQVLQARPNLGAEARKPVEPPPEAHPAVAAVLRLEQSRLARGLLGVLSGSGSGPAQRQVSRPPTWRYTQPETS